MRLGGVQKRRDDSRLGAPCPYRNLGPNDHLGSKRPNLLLALLQPSQQNSFADGLDSCINGGLVFVRFHRPGVGIHHFLDDFRERFQFVLWHGLALALYLQAILSVGSYKRMIHC